MSEKDSLPKLRHQIEDLERSIHSASGTTRAMLELQSSDFKMRRNQLLAQEQRKTRIAADLAHSDKLDLNELVELGESLKTIREHRDMSQEKLGKLLSVKQQQIGRWERDSYQSAKLRTLTDVVDALGVIVSINFELSNVDESESTNSIERLLQLLEHDYDKSNFENIKLWFQRVIKALPANSELAHRIASGLMKWHCFVEARDLLHIGNFPQKRQLDLVRLQAELGAQIHERLKKIKKASHDRLSRDFKTAMSRVIGRFHGGAITLYSITSKSDRSFKMICQIAPGPTGLHDLICKNVIDSDVAELHTTNSSELRQKLVQSQQLMGVPIRDSDNQMIAVCVIQAKATRTFNEIDLRDFEVTASNFAQYILLENAYSDRRGRYFGWNPAVHDWGFSAWLTEFLLEFSDAFQSIYQRKCEFLFWDRDRNDDDSLSVRATTGLDVDYSDSLVLSATGLTGKVSDLAENDILHWPEPDNRDLMINQDRIEAACIESAYGVSVGKQTKKGTRSNAFLCYLQTDEFKFPPAILRFAASILEDTLTLHESVQPQIAASQLISIMSNAKPSDLKARVKIVHSAISRILMAPSCSIYAVSEGEMFCVESSGLESAGEPIATSDAVYRLPKVQSDDLFVDDSQCDRNIALSQKPAVIRLNRLRSSNDRFQEPKEVGDFTNGRMLAISDTDSDGRNVNSIIRVGRSETSRRFLESDELLIRKLSSTCRSLMEEVIESHSTESNLERHGPKVISMWSPKLLPAFYSVFSPYRRTHITTDSEVAHFLRCGVEMLQEQACAAIFLQEKCSLPAQSDYTIMRYCYAPPGEAGDRICQSYSSTRSKANQNSAHAVAIERNQALAFSREFCPFKSDANFLLVPFPVVDA